MQTLQIQKVYVTFADGVSLIKSAFVFSSLDSTALAEETHNVHCLTSWKPHLSIKPFLPDKKVKNEGEAMGQQ